MKVNKINFSYIVVFLTLIMLFIGIASQYIPDEKKLFIEKVEKTEKDNSLKIGEKNSKSELDDWDHISGLNHDFVLLSKIILECKLHQFKNLNSEVITPPPQLNIL